MTLKLVLLTDFADSGKVLKDPRVIPKKCVTELTRIKEVANHDSQQQVIDLTEQFPTNQKDLCYILTNTKDYQSEQLNR